MSEIYIKNLSNDENVAGSFRDCLKNASSGDVVSLDPQVFEPFNVYTIDVEGVGILIDKSIVFGAGENRILRFVNSVPTSDRALRVAGTAAKQLEATIRNVMFEDVRTTNSGIGDMYFNYVTLTVDRCAFIGMEANSTSAGVYAINSTVKFLSTLLTSTTGYVLNYSNTATIVTDHCTLVGLVKAGYSAENSIVIPIAAVYNHFVDPDRNCYLLKSDSPYAEGSSFVEAQVDFYDNEYEEDGALGAFELNSSAAETLVATQDGLNVSFENAYPGFNRPVFEVSAGSSRFVATTRSAGYVTEDKGPISLYTFAGDEAVNITTSLPVDTAWIISCFLSLGIPVKNIAEAKTIIPNCVEIFKRQ